jgi:hypothetical protein
MRRMLVTAIIAGLLAAGMGGCARQPEVTAVPPAQTPLADWPAGVKETEVYVQVLRRYLGTPNENSFPDRTFETVYVLDQAYPDAGDPQGKHEPGAPIGPDTQRRLTAALTGVAHLGFITDRTAVIETRNGCAQVKNGGILITLGAVNGDYHEVQVGINGFVACLGATWLTYVVRNEPGSGWRVTGTTGAMAIS